MTDRSTSQPPELHGPPPPRQPERDPAPEASLEGDGYVVMPEAVDAAPRDAALRLLNLAIRQRGLTSEEILHCQGTTFFPDLRDDPAVWGALPPAAAALLDMADGDQWAEPQLLLRFPDEHQHWPLQPHIDQVPPWAPTRRYKGIVGVALTGAGAAEGAPCVWPGSHRGGPADIGQHRAVPLQAGAALVMHPDLQHAGSLNLGGQIRYAIYFRLLGPAHGGTVLVHHQDL